MELFAKDDSFKEYEKYKKLREEFKDANVEMTDTIDLKTSDPKNINYSEVHINIYEQVGLGKDWRVEKSQKSSELKKLLLDLMPCLKDLTLIRTKA